MNIAYKIKCVQRFSPGSGRANLHGKANGVNECWYTNEAKLPVKTKKNEI